MRLSFGGPGLSFSDQQALRLVALKELNSLHPAQLLHPNPQRTHAGEAAGAINSTPLDLALLKDSSEDAYAAQRVQVGGCVGVAGCLWL